MKDIYDVVGIGNAIVDVITFCEEEALDVHQLTKGAMTLIDEARAETLYEVMENAAECSGGSVANTLAGMASLGADTAFIGKVKHDQLGEIFRHDMHSVGVHFDTPPLMAGPATARCLIFVTPDAQRTMNTYIGACAQVVPDDINEALIGHAKLTYVEGYLWDQPAAKEAIRRAFWATDQRGKKVAMSLSDTFCVERHRMEFHDLVSNHVNIVFANESEIKSLYQTNDFDIAMQQIQGKCDIAVLTRSEKGAYVVTPHDKIFVESQQVPDVIDSTGAGDLFAAGFLYGYTHNWSLEDAAKLGHKCAARIIAQLGARSIKPLNTLLADFNYPAS